MKFITLFGFLFFLFFNCNAADNLATLNALYPDQSKDFIKTRVQNSKNLHKFFRSFVRYYYSLLKKNPDFISSLSSLKNFSGSISGDPHVENFGFLVDKNHHAYLSFNDFDDADTNDLMFDTLRHLTSALIIKPELNVENYLQSYLAGLEGGTSQLGAMLKQMKDESERKGHRLSNDDVDSEKKSFLNYKKVVIEMSEEEKNSTKKKLETLVKQKFDTNAKIFDLYKRTKDSGGSAGLIRYELLVTIRNNLHWLELKEFTTAAPTFYTNSKISKDSRIELIRNNLLPTQLKEDFDLVNFQGKTYLTSFIWDGEKGIDFQEMAEKNWENVIYTEVKLLGLLHGKSMVKAKAEKKLINYREAVANLPIENWKMAAKKTIQKFSETYQNVKD